MKNKTLNIVGCALSIVLVSGCDQMNQVIDLGNKSKQELDRAQSRLNVDADSTEKRDSHRRSESDAFTAIVAGKMFVLSNRVVEATAAIKTLEADRNTFSHSLGESMSGAARVGGVGLEKALASPIVNKLAMKYLNMDFSVARGEYSEAIAKARESEAAFKSAMAELKKEFDGQLDRDSPTRFDAKRTGNISELKRELSDLQRKQQRLMRTTLPTGSAYQNKRDVHRRELGDVQTRIRDVQQALDRLSSENNERNRVDFNARRVRENALRERNQAMEKLKREYEKKTTVLKTVEVFNEKTLKKLEQALVRQSLLLEEKLRKSREGIEFLRGLSSGAKNLSPDAFGKLNAQVNAL